MRGASNEAARERICFTVSVMGGPCRRPSHDLPVEPERPVVGAEIASEVIDSFDDPGTLQLCAELAGDATWAQSVTVILRAQTRRWSATRRPSMRTRTRSRQLTITDGKLTDNLPAV